MENTEIGNRNERVNEEKIIKNIVYDSQYSGGRNKHSKLLLDLEIEQRRDIKGKSSPRRVVVTVEAQPKLETLFQSNNDKSNSYVKVFENFADTASEQSKFRTQSSSSYSKIDVNRHCSINTRCCHSCELYQNYFSKYHRKSQADDRLSQTTITVPQVKITCDVDCKQYKKKCYIKREGADMKSAKNETQYRNHAQKIDKATLIITNTSSDESSIYEKVIERLNRRIQSLELKVRQQEMVFRNIQPTRSRQNATSNGVHNASYVQQYSHIPETSGFQRSRHPTAAATQASARRTINKEHYSEQYGRDFTAYDGITDTRRRRESASMPLNRCEALEVSPVLRSRGKHNTIRDYRLMDTVHYLAQGEFAPRNDGIKLTPSREAVLSDIIWEDVCRSHWPSARLTRHRNANKHDRSNHRTELQRQIDSLLRERVTHIERRRRRHYRVMKMNQEPGSSKGIGKTGDVIVANNKNSSRYENDNNSDDPSLSTDFTDKNNKSDEDSTIEKQHHRSRNRAEGMCTAGPSPESQRKYRECSLANDLIRSSVEMSSQMEDENSYDPKRQIKLPKRAIYSTGSSDMDQVHRPRLVVKKKEPVPRRVHPSQEHYVLLPTLVMKTSSTFSKQRKFHQLYRALKSGRQHSSDMRPMENVHLVHAESPNRTKRLRTKDVGLNVNITETSDTSIN